MLQAAGLPRAGERAPPLRLAARGRDLIVLPLRINDLAGPQRSLECATPALSEGSGGKVARGDYVAIATDVTR